MIDMQEYAVFTIWFDGWHDPNTGRMEASIQREAAWAAWQAAKAESTQMHPELPRPLFMEDATSAGLALEDET